MRFDSSALKNRREKKERTMKKETTKRRQSIDFSKGIRGKYADMNLKIVGAVNDEDAKAVLKKVSRVLNSAGTSKRDLEVAIERARDLIASSVLHEPSQ
jgi:hypothetical protein